MTVVEFSAARVEPYLMQAVTLFLSDPPTTRWQLGYLAALLNVYREAVPHGAATQDARVLQAEAMLKRLGQQIPDPTPPI